MYTICFTGHRSLLDEKTVQHQIAATLDFFIQKYGDIHCKTSLAAGADILFAKEVLKRKIPLEIYLPFELEEFIEDFSADELKKFNSVISIVDYKVEKKLTSVTLDEKNQAFLELGKKLIQSSDALIAVWDGQDRAGVGGTKDQIDLALSQFKEVHWIKAYKGDREYLKKNEPYDNLCASFTGEDKLAILYKKKYKKSWALGLILGMLAVFSFAFNFSLISKEETVFKFILSVTEILFLLGSFYLLNRSSNEAKNKFVLHRTKAEQIRGEIWLNETNELKSFFQTFQHNVGSERSLSLNTQRIIYTYAHEQLHYQKKSRIHRFEVNLTQTHRVLSFLKYLFLIIVFLIAIMEGTHAFHINLNIKHELVTHLLCFFWILIPPAYATIEGVVYFNEWKKQIALSKSLTEQFELIGKNALKSDKQESLIQLEEKLLQTFKFEQINWVENQNQKKIHSKI